MVDRDENAEAIAGEEQEARRATVSILDDLPTDQDALDFEPYVDTLADIIASPSTGTPLTIGIFGDWGSGKTSLMRMVRKELPPNYCLAWFDAWKYDEEQVLWRALLLQVLDALRRAVPEDESEASQKALAELSDLETCLYRALDREQVGGVQIDWGKLCAGVAGGAVQIGLAFIPGGSVLTDLIKELRSADRTESAAAKLISAIHRERSQIHIEQVRFLEQFQRRFHALVAGHVVARDSRLVVFIDDLDRCLPEKAVDVLEAIKLFMDAPGCVFVLGLDQQVIARGIEIKYREAGLTAGPPEERKGNRPLIDGTRYLEKIIQLPFHIPPIGRGEIDTFVRGLVDVWPHDQCAGVFAEGLGDNPRQVKRMVNVFLMLWQLTGRRGEKLRGQIKPVRLAKVVAIQHIDSGLYRVLRETPRLLRDLEGYYRAEGYWLDLAEALAEAPQEAPEPPPALAPYVSRAAVRRLLTMHPVYMPEVNFGGLPPDELRLYFTLTRRAEAPRVSPAERRLAAFEPQLVRIPAGPFLMGSSERQVQQAFAAGLDEEWTKAEGPQHTVELPEYAIGKYPLTNAEYQAFVRESGHKPPRHWDGQDYPEELGGHPVVNISWEDALAYCRWLSDQTGRNYRLPTEAEWEKAARGTDGRLYPWGDEPPDKTRCNHGRHVGHTTPVGQYSPRGDSPYGCADMAGNVWEWTQSLYVDYPYEASDGREDLEASGRRVRRGGSFVDDGKVVRCACRYWIDPYNLNIYRGVRVVVAPV